MRAELWRIKTEPDFHPGTRQKEIRATVSRFPYLNEDRNQDVDVGKILHIATRR